MSAGIRHILALDPSLVQGMQDFQTGGLYGVSMRRVLPPGIAILAGTALALVFAGELEVLGLGEDTARSLGLEVKHWRIAFLLLASMLAGCAVSFCGLISFVGLIAPHLSRLLLPGGAKRTHLALSALTGGSLLAVCDTLSRTLFSPFELPVGIFLSYLGAPFFFWLIFRGRRMRRD